MTPQVRFDRFVRRGPEPNACWEWTGGRVPSGYGMFYLDRAHRVTRTHRVAWAFAYGPIPAGLWVLHRCDNPPCVRPDHLYLGTHADNMADIAARGRTRLNKVRGEAHPRARLTVADVLLIRRRAAAGDAPAGIAREYGLAQSGIMDVIRRETWKHVP